MLLPSKFVVELAQLRQTFLRHSKSPVVLRVKLNLGTKFTPSPLTKLQPKIFPQKNRTKILEPKQLAEKC